MTTPVTPVRPVRPHALGDIGVTFVYDRWAYSVAGVALGDIDVLFVASVALPAARLGQH